jgi:hypothetical protein
MRDSFDDTGCQILNCIHRREECFAGVVDASVLVVVDGRHAAKESSSTTFHHAVITTSSHSTC